VDKGSVREVGMSEKWAWAPTERSENWAWAPTERWAWDDGVKGLVIRETEAELLSLMKSGPSSLITW